MQHKAIVMGSVNLDNVYSVEAIVRPGETISAKGHNVFWGGKGLNQAIALAKAGMPTGLSAKINSAQEADLKNLCSDSGIESSALMTTTLPTGHAIIQVDSAGQNSIVVFPGANGSFTNTDVDAVLSGIEPGDCLLLQNEINLLPYIIRQAHSKGIFVVLNPSPICSEMKQWPLDCVDMLIMNETEGAALSDKANPEDILRSLQAHYPHCRFVLTLGSDGSRYSDGHQSCIQPAFPATAVDTTAAGDTFTGFFLANFFSGSTIQQSLEIASMAAALAVSVKGAAESIPTAAQVKEVLSKK